MKRAKKILKTIGTAIAFAYAVASMTLAAIASVFLVPFVLAFKYANDIAEQIAEVEETNETE